MNGRHLLDLGLCEAGALLARGAISPVELTAAYLDRIESTESCVNAYVTVCADVALETARVATDEIRRHGSRGALHGIPVGIKDIIDTAGIRTTCGSSLYADRVPDRDARVVADLRRAGAVTLGKHATHELAWGGRTDNASPRFGPTRNPYDPERIPGGSSGGAAASLVARSSLGAVGTDTAGSVRIPAALSGCVGLKPTRGRISLDGVLPLAHTLDHVGVLGRSVADAACLFGALAGDGTPAGGDLRFGRLRSWPEACLGPGVRTALDTACADLRASGVALVDVVLPDAPGLTGHLLDRVAAGGVATHAREYAASPTAFGPDLSELLAVGTPCPERLAEGDAVIARAGADLLDGLRHCDVLVSATVPVTAPRIGQMSVTVDGEPMHVEHALTRLTSLANALGVPALSVPIGLAGGLPVGLQVIGRTREEPTVLAAGRVVERVIGPLPSPAVSC